LKTPTALGNSNRQTTTHCYNSSQELKPPNISALPCCSTIRFYGAECRNVAKGKYHKTLYSRDFGILYKEAEKAQDIEDPKGVNAMVGHGWVGSVLVLSVGMLSQSLTTRSPPIFEKYITS
jgi:hypothetical protein